MIEDTLRRHPEIGAATSVLAPIVNILDTVGIFLGIIGACIGITIGAYTLLIKKMEYQSKLEKK
mgnify:CR=1 FL=1